MKRFSIGLFAALFALAGAWIVVRAGGAREKRDASPSPAQQVYSGAMSEDSAELTAIEPPSLRQTLDDFEGPGAAAPTSSGHDTRLSVRVVARETREPMAEIDVRLWTNTWNLDESVVPMSDELPDPSRGLAGDSLRTDADGRVSFAVEAAVPYALDVYTSLRGRRVEQELEPLRRGEIREHEIEVETAYDLTWRGRVLDSATGGSIADARIVLTEIDTELDEQGITVDASTELDATTSAADGRFSLAAPSWLNRLALVVDAPGYSTGFVRPSDARENESDELEVKLDRPATLEVRVVDGVSPPRRRVRITIEAWYRDALLRPESRAPTRFEATTDETGVALLGPLPPGVKLSAHFEELSGEDRVRRFEDHLTLAPGEHRTYEVELVRGARVHGVVRDQFGTPCATTRLWLVTLPEPVENGFLYDRSRWRGLDESWVPAFTTTDEDGRYAFEDVPAGWTGIAPADLPLDSAVLLADRCAPAVTSFMVEADAETEVDLRVERGLYIAGRVVGPKGDPQPGSVIHCLGPSAWIRLETETDEAGRFRFGPLVEGQYGLSAEPGWHAVFATNSASVLTRAGESDVSVALRAGGVLTARVIDRSGAGEEPAFWLQLRQPADPNLGPWRWRAIYNFVDGILELWQLDPGVYDLLVSNDHGEFAVARGVVVKEDERTPCTDLIFEPSGRVEIECRVPADSTEVPVHHVRARFEDYEFFTDQNSRALEHGFDAPPGAIEIEIVLRDEQGPEHTHREIIDVSAAQRCHVVVPLDF